MPTPQGINALVGSVDFEPAAGGERSAPPKGNAVPSAGSLFTGNGTDGTEMIVGAIVLISLAILIGFRVGGFQAIIAS